MRIGGGIPGRKARPVVERIAEKVALNDAGCVVWIGSLDIGGYGHLSIGSKRDGTMRKGKAHRVLYELTVGQVPEGLDLDHLCRNRACVRQDHLEPVTRRVNVLRGETLPAANAAKTHCPKGHPYSGANLGWDRSKNGRVCRACKAEQQRRIRAARRSAS